MLQERQIPSTSGDLPSVADLLDCALDGMESRLDGITRYQSTRKRSPIQGSRSKSKPQDGIAPKLAIEISKV